MGSLASINIRFNTDLKSFSTGMQNVNRSIQKASANMKRTGGIMTASITAPLTILAYKGVEAWDKQAKAIAQVETGLKSTGNAVGIASEKLQKIASDLQGNSLFGDEEILQGVTAQLLTFTNIAGNEFERTQKAALDLATRLDGDLKSASIQLGKALNDPVANLSALSRSGIQFSQSQKEVINQLWKTGQQAEAQKIILSELEKQYGGSAEAAAKAGTGAFKQLQNSFGDLLEDFGKIITEFLTPLANYLKEGIAWFKGLSDETKKWIVVVGGIAAAIGPLLALAGTILPALISGFTILTGPVGIIVAAVAAIATLIISNWDDVVKMVQEVVEWFSNLYNESEALRFAVQGIGATFKAIWVIIKTVASGIWEVIKGLAKSIGNVFSTLFKSLDKLIRGDFSGAFDEMKNGFQNSLSNFTQTFSTIGAEIQKAWTDIKSIYVEVPVKASVKIDKNAVQSSIGNATDEIKKTVSDFTNFGGGDESEGSGVGVTIPVKAKADTSSVKKVKEEADIAKGSINDLNNQIDVLTQKMNNESDPRLIEKYKFQIDSLKTELESLTLFMTDLQATPAGVVIEPFEGEIEDTKMSAAIKQSTTTLNEQLEPMTEGLNAWTEQLENFNDSTSQLLNDFAQNVVTSFGESIGGMIAGSNKMGNLLGNILGMFAQFVVSYGKMAIKFGITQLALKTSFTNPFSAIAAGIALVAIGTAMKAIFSNTFGGGNPPALASGGLVYGDTLVQVGEYRNSSINPEVIAPLNTLKKFIQPGGFGGGEVIFKQQGGELVGVLNYTENVNKKIS